MADNAQSRNLLLASLERDDYALLRPHLTEIRLEQKVILQRPGSPITHAYFPLSGMISMLATFPTGEAIEIAAIGREGAVGTRLGRLPEIAFAQGIVQLPGSALRIGIERFREAARNSLGITEIAACANEVLARWLLHSRDRSDTDRLPLSQEFLSQMLGVRRTTVTLAAHTLQAAGVVSYRRGKIEITDRKGLEAIACDCYLMVKRNIEIVTAPRKSAKMD